MADHPPCGLPGQSSVCLTEWDVLQVFVESGEALVYAEGAEPHKLQDGDFYGEEPFITTLSMMVEENCALTVEAAANTQRKEGLKAVSDCHCLELGIKDVFEAFGSNRNVLRLLTRFNTIPSWALLVPQLHLVDNPLGARWTPLCACAASIYNPLMCLYAFTTSVFSYYSPHHTTPSNLHSSLDMFQQETKTESQRRSTRCAAITRCILS